MARSRVLNLQRRHVYEVGEKHYDIGNELYSRMLDKRMVYSCGYWKEARTLDAAQEAKLDLICRKAGLEPGMRILDIGSGWGGFLRFAAERYGVEGIGLTISKEQAEYASMWAEIGDRPEYVEAYEKSRVTEEECDRHNDGKDFKPLPRLNRDGTLATPAKG